MGNRDIRRSVDVRGMGRGTWGIQDGHYRDFQEGNLQGEFAGRESREFEGGGLGWIIGGRKDRGFG